MATETGEALDQPEKQRRRAEARQAGERGERSRRRRKRPKKPVFRSEAEINVPDRQTLGFLGATVLVTLVLWAFARAACNHHPPRETRRPRVVKTEEFARDPKSAAIEFFQRLGSANFKGASELASTTAASEVERERQSCEANAAACADRRKNAERVVTMGAVLEKELAAATVRVESTVAGKKQPYIVRLERDQSAWKVASWEPDTGQFKPKPATPISVNLRPAPSASAPAPAASP